MNNPDLFWFRTRQGLLEEWGYIPGAWHLIRRSKVSITVLGVSAQDDLSSRLGATFPKCRLPG
jgi:hypothetical protein